LLRALTAAGPLATAEQLTRAVLAELGSPPESLRVLDVRPVRFECRCSRQRAAGSLALLGSPELASMIVEDGTAEVICNFCHEHYQFTEAELETIRRESSGPSGPPS
jgi:molecular chaperone Hsp33